MRRTKDSGQRTSHTPEPWHYEMDYSIWTIAQDLDGTYIAEIDGQDVGRSISREQHEANARRICAAVNACTGIPTEALEQGVVAELRAALQRLLDDLYDAEEDRNPETGVEYHSVANARAVIARASAA